MSNELSLLSAFLTGFIGSVHCIGMCGGIIGALTMGLPHAMRDSPRLLLPYVLTYNLGRITSYMIAGILVGFLGAQFAHLLPIENPRTIAAWVSGIFLILLGLYISQWWQGLVWLEKAGGHLWRKVEPLSKRLLPIHNPGRAFLFGLVWGWLPCGMVYAVLVLALTSANAIQGGAVMLAFGLGTLPMLLLLGSTVQWFTQFTRHLIVHRIVGTLIIVFGLYTFFAPAPMHTHGQTSSSHTPPIEITTPSPHSGH